MFQTSGGDGSSASRSAACRIAFTSRCASMICYRRSRYVDASPISKTSYGKTESSDRDREPRIVRIFSWFEKKLNGWITAFAAAVIGLSLMKLISEDFLAIAPDSAAALKTGTRMYTTGLAALFLLAHCSRLRLISAR
jgi:hypothetical protein